MKEYKNKFVFVIPFYNEVHDIKKTIYSMMSQSYDNWRAVLINDGSTDGTDVLVRNLIPSLPAPFHSKIQLIDRGSVKYGEVRNTLDVLKNVDDQEIVCRLDGGDWLTENDLLHILNQVYSDPEVAVVWTAHRWGYTNRNISGAINLMHDRPTVYVHPWVSSHLKTFRAKHLKEVPRKNFLTDEGEFIMIACDQAIFLPMMHLALRQNKKLVYVPIVAYHYNIDLEKKDLFTSDRAVTQKMSAEMIRRRGYLE